MHFPLTIVVSGIVITVFSVVDFILADNELAAYTSSPAKTTSIEIGTKTFADAVTGDIEDDDVATGFTNSKDGTIPTGVILSIAGPAVVGLAVIGGLIFMIIKRKKEDSED